MAKFTGSGNAGTANTTAATRGIIKVEQGATVKSIKLFEWEISPQANAADNNYGVRLFRQSTAGTWTAVTPAPFDFTNARASDAVCGVASTAAGTAIGSSELLRVGFNQRAGYRWVAVPGAEFLVGSTATPSTGHGVVLEYTFAQGTDVNGGSMSWDE